MVRAARLAGMAAGNALDAQDAGLSLVVLATGCRPRRFMGDGFDGDFSLAGVDPA